MSKKGNLDSIFNPKLVAIAGVSTGNYGQMFLDNVLGCGATRGSGGLIVLDEDNCMVDAALYFLDFTQKESCGKCTLCRLGTKQMLDILIDIVTGRGKIGDIDLLIELAEDIKEGSLCGLGETAPNSVLTTLRYFRSEYEAHIIEHRCPALVCKELITYYILPDRCDRGCEHCVLSCPGKAISSDEKRLKVIDPTKCVKYGTCREVCPPRIMRWLSFPLPVCCLGNHSKYWRKAQISTINPFLVPPLLVPQQVLLLVALPWLLDQLSLY